MSNKIAKKTNVKIKTKATTEERFILRLFVTGILPNSVRAIKNINAICDEYLKGRYELEIVDIYQQPSLALTEKIIAVPLLIKKFPLPEVKLIGDLSDREKVLKELNLN